MNPVIVAIDFDNTIFNSPDDYDDIPKQLIPKAKETIKWLSQHGCYIIIWTCRKGKYLEMAKMALKDNDIPYDAINTNYEGLDFKTSPKIYYDILIDDHNFDAKIDWMDIRKKIKKILAKKYADEILKLRKSQLNGDKYKCCIMIPAPHKLSSQIIEIGNKIDKKILDEKDGLEKSVHTTLIYGITHDAKERFKSIFENPIKIKTDTKISYFDNRDRNQSVAIVKVFSEDMERLHFHMRKKFDNRQTFKEFKPHVTIAYLKYGKRLPDGIKIKSVEWEADEVEFSYPDESIDHIKKSFVDLEDTFRGMAPAFRGKPNDLNPDEGMDESVQKMYDGINDEGEPSKKYDQIPIMDKKRDWIDDEALWHKYGKGHIVYLDIPVEYSIGRDTYRGETEGRSVGSEVIKSIDSKLPSAFKSLSQSSVVDRFLKFKWDGELVKGKHNLVKDHKKYPYKKSYKDFSEEIFKKSMPWSKSGDFHFEFVDPIDRKKIINDLKNNYKIQLPNGNIISKSDIPKWLWDYLEKFKNVKNRRRLYLYDDKNHKYIKVKDGYKEPVKKIGSVREDFYDKAVDFHVNPKMTGEKVDVEILQNPDEEAMKYMDNFIEHYKVKKDEPPDMDRPKVKYPDRYLDNIEVVPRDRSVDDKAPWKNYWQENGMHRTRLMANVKKIAKIILKG